MDPEAEERRPSARGRGLWLLAIAVLVILFGGGTAVWSLLRELRSAPGALERLAPIEAVPSPSATFATMESNGARAP